MNAVRGSLDILARVITDARPTRAIACLDLDWRPAWRVELIPSYKTHRVLEPQSTAAATVVELAGTPHSGTPGASADIEVVPDELSPQVPILLDVLAAIGIATAGAEGFEADDVIGTLTATERLDPVEVVTGDRDLFQVARDDDPAVCVRYIGAGMSKAAVYRRRRRGHQVRHPGRVVTPTSPRCAAIRRTGCPACRVSATRPRPP